MPIHLGIANGRRPRTGLRIFPPSTPQPPARPPEEVDRQAKIVSNGKEYPLKGEDLSKITQLGIGGYGVVDKMKHEPSGKEMAVKRIRFQVNTKEDQRLLMDLDVCIRSSDCQYTVQFFGALFYEGDVWICMEVMDTCLDKFYKAAKKRNMQMPENILSKVTYATVSALHYLQTELKVMHRDVKPSNILANRNGEIKVCDFGVSGQLVDSLAKTIEAGSKPYMAPERIDPTNPAKNKGFDIKSDIWSLGITIMELAENKYPYEKWPTPFKQLQQVVKEPSPKLPGTFSCEIRDFLDQCLQKDAKLRPNYRKLLQHRFITKYAEVTVEDISQFITLVLDSPLDQTGDQG
ncbi:hypothetical protein BSL78_25763 [Apostichopus japonicus]|uniref:mitogen-activated protein kinase kinase n=1 Tax=Stichopus japonicus TaxID=307972 RepID=A0A2G8JNS1_STIJA|nr:hypothetical protein BSL78_25763 [Apostichopus japonicus]